MGCSCQAIPKTEVDNYALAQRVLEGRDAFLAEGFADPADDGPAVSPGR